LPPGGQMPRTLSAAQIARTLGTWVADTAALEVYLGRHVPVDEEIPFAYWVMSATHALDTVRYLTCFDDGGEIAAKVAERAIGRGLPVPPEVHRDAEVMREAARYVEVTRVLLQKAKCWKLSCIAAEYAAPAIEGMFDAVYLAGGDEAESAAREAVRMDVLSLACT
jgi:hypothetical protein